MSIWLCRAGRVGEYEAKFLEDNRIYCTFSEVKISMSSFKSKKDLQKHFEAGDKNIKPKTAVAWAGQCFTFANTMNVGDWVILPSKTSPAIHVGEIVSTYEFDGESEENFRHFHSVNWFAPNFPKLHFEQDIIFSFGAAMTICQIKQEERIKNIVKQHNNVAVKENVKSIVDDESYHQRDIEVDAIEEITTWIIQHNKGHELADIVAAILRAKGFTTYISPKGADKGVDILASNGNLGFSSPKICVQVKSSDGAVDRMVLDQLVGAMANFNADYGLLVSWSGFKSSVINETAAQFFKVRLWTHIEVVNELLMCYDKLDEKMKERIPLKRIWTLDDLRI